MFSGLEVAHDPRRRWTALASFTLQVALVSATLVAPMIHPRSLPEAFAIRKIFLPTPKGDVHGSPNQGHVSTGARPIIPIAVNNTFTFHHVDDFRSSEGPEQAPALPIGDPRSDVINSIAVPGPTIVHPTPRPSNIRQSVIMSGNLIHRVEPQYPAPARALHIEGDVVIKAFIGRAGEIERVQVVSGHPFLARAAIDAVQQWKYRPYYLNGEPIDVETQITVKFVLNR